MNDFGEMRWSPKAHDALIQHALGRDAFDGDIGAIQSWVFTFCCG
jgi:hypothetical protein